MKDRIIQIMKMENMTQLEFAKALEVSPSSLSNIFNGRTNPTSNHVNAIHKRFPSININWLMFGEGSMYDATDGGSQTEGTASSSDANEADASSLDSPTLFALMDEEEHKSSPMSSPTAGLRQEVGSGSQIPVIREVVKYIDKPQRKITEIRIFFDDGTFEVFSGGR